MHPLSQIIRGETVVHSLIDKKSHKGKLSYTLYLIRSHFIQMHAQTIKCVFNRIGMPKLLGLMKFRLTNFLKDYLFYFNFFFK